jgi:hypothetical protein
MDSANSLEAILPIFLVYPVTEAINGGAFRYSSLQFYQSPQPWLCIFLFIRQYITRLTIQRLTDRFQCTETDGFGLACFEDG